LIINKRGKENGKKEKKEEINNLVHIQRQNGKNTYL
jgi:hypothetical protein